MRIDGRPTKWEDKTESNIDKTRGELGLDLPQNRRQLVKSDKWQVTSELSS